MYAYVLKFKGYKRIYFKNRSHISVEMYLGKKLAFKMIFFYLNFLTHADSVKSIESITGEKKKALNKEKVTQNL